MDCIDGCCYTSGDGGFGYLACMGASDDVLRSTLESRDKRPYKIVTETRNNGVTCTQFLKDDAPEAWNRYNAQQAWKTITSFDHFEYSGLRFFGDVLHWANRIFPK